MNRTKLRILLTLILLSKNVKLNVKCEIKVNKIQIFKNKVFRVIYKSP